MMNTRPLTAKESRNLAVLNAAGIESVPLFLTATGYRKAICDATDPMRAFLLKHSIHDYSTQGQGPDNKVIRQIQFLTEKGMRFMNMALYRPVTKKGDPRLWVHGWKAFVDADNVLAFFFDNGLVDFTRGNIVILTGWAIQKSFIMSQIQICFGTIFGYVAFAVFVWIKGSRINIEIRIKFLDSDFKPPALQQFCQ